MGLYNMENKINRLKAIKEASITDLVGGENLVWLMKKIILEQNERIEQLERDMTEIDSKNEKHSDKKPLLGAVYTEEEVEELLITQRGNCYVAILSATKNQKLAELATKAPEPWRWRK